ncbi:MAG: ABC transporter ATP-binding protein [Thermomicrobiales bacterium]
MQLQTEQVGFRYQDVQAVDSVSLGIERGTFLSILGPSGCGKTTLLRLIAGFLRPAAGRIQIAGRTVADAADGVYVPPERRRLGMVFQAYALWPHMRVWENVAYPLRFRRVGRTERKTRALRMLEMVDLAAQADRFPAQLSGGQQQRVSLARALVAEPDLLLLDEPLSNLDAKLRERMRAELRDLPKRLGSTVVYVTHDQEEALALSDSMAVMQAGRVEQFDRPEAVYRAPASEFVAGFVGRANFLHDVRHRGEGRLEIPTGGDWRPETDDANWPTGSFTLVVRPEAVTIEQPDACSVGCLIGTIERRTFLGRFWEYDVRAGEHHLLVETPPDVTYEPGAAVALRLQRANVLGHSNLRGT